MTQQQSAESALTGVRNFRDLGGLPTADGGRVRPGRLYRSGHLAHATEQDRAFLSGLGLHTVFDFRDAADHALDGLDVELPGVRNVNIPLTDPAEGAEFWRMVRQGDLGYLRRELGDGRGAGRMVAAYRAMVRTRRPEHGRVLRTLAEGSMPALLHCAAGKDRAGLTIALVLLAGGVERDAITDDYLLSNSPHRRYRMRSGGRGSAPDAAEISELLSPLFEARSSYLDAAFEQITEDWGTTERYLAEGLEITPSHRERLRATLLHG